MIKDKLKQESVDALKNHDSKRVGVLRFLISLIDKKELSLPVGMMKETDEISVIRKELKNKEESREMFLKADRSDLVEQMDYEIALVKSYLPAEVTEDQVKEVVDQVVMTQGNNFGMVMKEVMNKLNGAVDGSIVSKIVKEKLNQ